MLLLFRLVPEEPQVALADLFDLLPWVAQEAAQSLCVRRPGTRGIKNLAQSLSLIEKYISSAALHFSSYVPLVAAISLCGYEPADDFW